MNDECTSFPKGKRQRAGDVVEDKDNSNDITRTKLEPEDSSTSTSIKHEESTLQL
jgi:hypothetical protein